MKKPFQSETEMFLSFKLVCSVAVVGHFKAMILNDLIDDICLHIKTENKENTSVDESRLMMEPY